MHEPKILLIDLETAPNLVYTWGFYEQDTSLKQTVREGYVLCYCYKWLHEKRVKADSIHYHKGIGKDCHDDSEVIKSAWALLDEADIVIAHNGDRFDIKWLNASFLKHGLFPPSPYKTIDTLKASRANFKQNSHSLNDQSIRYKLGEKVDTGGFELWADCMAGKRTAFDKMVAYCKHDVALLESWYLKIRPWIKNHPNLTIYTSDADKCPTCLGPNYSTYEKHYCKSGWKQGYKCNDCGRRFTGKKTHKRLDKGGTL